MKLKQAIEKRWYSQSPGFLYALLPLEGLFRSIVSKRRHRHLNEPKSHSRDAGSAPVIVVGNLSVGGTGKTPVIIALVNWLSAEGYKVGVVSRGYGRQKTGLHRVDESSKPAEAGDEPLEIFQRCRCDIVVHENRAKAVTHLTEIAHPDLILSDDGLQHYAMNRQLEIVVANADQGFGNGHCLPVGPLREPLSRLESVDFLLINGEQTPHHSLKNAVDGRRYAFSIKPSTWIGVKSGLEKALEFKPGQNLCAYAGIGQPQKFFAELKKLGLRYTQFARQDHASYSASDFNNQDFDAYVMTAKDAVKCRDLVRDNAWYLQVDAQLPERFKRALLEKIRMFTKN